MSDSASRRKLARAAARLAAAARSELPALVLMTDDDRLPDPLAAARALPRGSLIIARARSRDCLHRLAYDLRPIAAARDLFLLAAGEFLPGLDGVHLPESRIGEAAGLRARHPMLITASVHSFGALKKAAQVDAVLLSAVFPTQSHPGRAALSPLRANAIARQSPVPVFALGGITAENAARLTGFEGIAAIGALAV